MQSVTKRLQELRRKLAQNPELGSEVLDELDEITRDADELESKEDIKTIEVDGWQISPGVRRLMRTDFTGKEDFT